MIDLEASLAALRAVWGSGPGMHKCPDDVARYERILERVRPALVIETGLYYGGSARFFAERVPQVLSIEKDAARIARYRGDAYGLGAPPANVAVFNADSTSPGARAMARGYAKRAGGAVLVSLDSSHEYNHVLVEAALYADLVTMGSNLVIEDGLLHWVRKPQGMGDPWLAARKFLGGSLGGAFRADYELEDMFPTTTSPGGWLRRVR